MKITRLKSSAFTLIELLVVVGIIGVLAVIAFPAWQSVRTNTEQTQCASKLRNLAAAGLHWVNDHNGSLPDAMYWRYPNETHEGSLLPYLGFRESMLGQKQQTALSCPASFRKVGPNADWNRSYSINIYACAGENGKRETPFDRGCARLSQVGQASRMAFFMDGNFLVGGAPERKVGPASAEVPWNEAQKIGFFDQHQGKRFNVVFLDGHLQSVSRDELPKGSPVEQRLNPFWGAIQ